MRAVIAMGLIITSVFSGLAFAGNDLESDAEQPYSQIRYLMGTVARIDVWTGDRGQAEAATKAAFEEIAKLESLCSSWRPDSEVSRINKNVSQNSIYNYNSFPVIFVGHGKMFWRRRF